MSVHIHETTCEECPIGKGEWCKGCDSFPYKSDPDKEGER
jgi:hypothetical protein